MSSFEDAFTELIGIEGGYVKDPDDPGGETKYGISKRAYPDVDIKNLTLEDAKQIYWRDFWNKLLLSQLRLYDHQVELFEQAVNFGVGVAARHAQQALRLIGHAEIALDGVIGPKTMAAINSLDKNMARVFDKVLNGLQFMRYIDIVEGRAASKKYLVGWLKRVSFDS